MLILTTFLSSCALFRDPVKEIEVVTKTVERVPLNIPDQDPLYLVPPEWFVVTPNNIDEVWRQLEEDGFDVVLFAVTDEGYKQISYDFLKIRQHINYNKFIIRKYKEYYEPKKDKDDNGKD